MAIVSRRIAKCYLKGESYIHIFYDDITLDILRFEIKGSIKSKLTLTINEPDIKEEINTTGKIDQGDDIQIVEPIKKWKMIQVIENEEKKTKLPIHMKLLASWEVL